MKKARMLQSLCLLGVVLCCGSCADVQTHIQPCLEGQSYGFWGGLWHGIVSPIAFIGSLFNDGIAVWAVNNNGGWYTFGFVLGAGILGGSSSSAAKSRK